MDRSLKRMDACCPIRPHPPALMRSRSLETQLAGVLEYGRAVADEVIE
jgi:hypothetical protein